VCDFVYTIGDCGWPTKINACSFCNRPIAGEGHTLEMEKEGARRLELNLLFLGSSFSNYFTSTNTYYPPFYVSNLKVSAYWRSLPWYIRK
jgi:hypothetical protein